MLVFLGSVQLLFDLPNSFMEYIFILKKKKKKN